MEHSREHEYNPLSSDVPSSTDEKDETESLLMAQIGERRPRNSSTKTALHVMAILTTLSLMVLTYNARVGGNIPQDQANEAVQSALELPALPRSPRSYSHDTLKATAKPVAQDHNATDTSRPTGRSPTVESAAKAASCSPRLIRLDSVDMKTNRFYSELSQLNPPLTAPVFTSHHQQLCSENKRTKQRWDYCLPISGRMDEPFCSGGDRLDLLAPQSPTTLCFSSVLHLLLVDVYEVLQATGASPALMYGSLLGAVRNSSVIPFTEDADIGYQLGERKMEHVREALYKRGYHLFKEVLWRVCVSPVHPLASRLYDATRGLPKCCNIPYVDLYRMQPHDDPALWSVEKTHKSRLIPREKILPYSSVHVNGRAFDTVADPVDFLVHEYGSSYMTPRPRPPQPSEAPPSLKKTDKKKVAIRLSRTHSPKENES